jgi:hypothetical protein
MPALPYSSATALGEPVQRVLGRDVVGDGGHRGLLPSTDDM